MLFREDPAAARWEPRQRMSEVWVTPVLNADGTHFRKGHIEHQEDSTWAVLR